ncbi:hypothetical protein DPEC_G00331470 [Dallia pectoralis]|uniref:Uncharacterized protein n=1 Tax=Dallia pectoralis TaxID=75939 RepID=A0ACC2F5W7_DALPE|nr:hypothetical protein DPEC_G00331470 [Dallia pectoralis]
MPVPRAPGNVVVPPRSIVCFGWLRKFLVDEYLGRDRSPPTKHLPDSGRPARREELKGDEPSHAGHVFQSIRSPYHHGAGALKFRAIRLGLGQTATEKSVSSPVRNALQGPVSVIISCPNIIPAGNEFKEVPVLSHGALGFQNQALISPVPVWPGVTSFPPQPDEPPDLPGFAAPR